MSVNIYNPTTGDLATVAIDGLEKVSALPSATTDLIDKIYLLTDEQTGYKKGGIYECQAVAVTPIGTENPSEEGWYELSGTDYVLSTDTTVDSGKTYYTIEWVLISSSGDTNIFNGTLAEWEALTAEEQANYSHIATPEEADITGSYSTTETKTGATWIDGKPIYRKVVEKNVNLSGNSWNNTGIDVSEIDTLCHCVMLNSKFAFGGFYTQKASNKLNVYCVSDANWGASMFILEYTKVSD